MTAKIQWSNPGTGIPNPPGFHQRANVGYTPIFNGKPCMTLEEYDGKRLRKTSMRKTVDYNCSVIKYLEDRIWQRGAIDRPALQPDVLYYPEMYPPSGYLDNPINAVCTRFVRTATNKMRCPVLCLAWTPEGRRLITGASSGEFTLWNSLTFNFETILQAHDAPVRSMVWSHSDQWMVTGDHGGYIKYWQMNMNNVKMFQAHKDPVRGITFCPTDQKMATCSDDGTVRLWDFRRCHEERLLRGHGSDVKCCDWHPYRSLIVSGSKDNQQPIRLWDPKSGASLATLHAHKSTVTSLRFNANGNWLLTASRDHLLKLYDLRRLDTELQVFRGHKKEAFCVAWHPIHETLVASGGSDGAIMFWSVGTDKEVGCIEQAHDSLIWELAWHPLGHVLASGSNDHSSRFWTRSRPGDTMLDKYNLNVADAAADATAGTFVLGSSSSSSLSAAVKTGADCATGTVAAAPATDGDNNSSNGADIAVCGERVNNGCRADQLVIPGMGPGDRVEPPAPAAAATGAAGGAGSRSHQTGGGATGDQRHSANTHQTRRPNWRFAHQWHQNWQTDWDEQGPAESDSAGGRSERPAPRRGGAGSENSDHWRSGHGSSAKRSRYDPAQQQQHESTANHEWPYEMDAAAAVADDDACADGGADAFGDYHHMMYSGHQTESQPWPAEGDPTDGYTDSGDQWQYGPDEDTYTPPPPQAHSHMPPPPPQFFAQQQRRPRFHAMRGRPARGVAGMRGGGGGGAHERRFAPSGQRPMMMAPAGAHFAGEMDSGGGRGGGVPSGGEAYHRGGGGGGDGDVMDGADEVSFGHYESVGGGGGMRERGGSAGGARGFARGRGGSAEFGDGPRGRWHGAAGGPMVRRGGGGPGGGGGIGARPRGPPDDEWMAGPRGGWRPPRGFPGRGPRRPGFY